ncbi:hypothetical protein DFH27DRAFT_526582 [Peziza echinospora]|nr:hypothetical protein DFH27DRAFT_526582 [Peziza echinospora]
MGSVAPCLHACLRGWAGYVDAWEPVRRRSVLQTQDGIVTAAATATALAQSPTSITTTTTTTFPLSFPSPPLPRLHKPPEALYSPDTRSFTSHSYSHRLYTTTLPNKQNQHGRYASSLVQQAAGDEIMTSVLTSPEITHSAGKSEKQQRAKLTKRPKTPTTPRTPGSGPGSSLSGSGFVTANSSNISVATNSGRHSYNQSTQSLSMSLTGKRSEVDNMPLPPPIKITPLGQVVGGGSFPPTPPGSHSSISGGGAMTPRRDDSPSRYMDGITPPFLQDERNSGSNGKNSRPSSAGSMFSRRKKEPKEHKEKDRDSFFGRDGELGEDRPSSKKRHSEELKKPSTPKSHSRSSSSIGLGSKGILTTHSSASVPHLAEWNYPPQRSSPLSAPIVNRTVHHHEYTSTDVPHYLPPLSLPHLELFEGGFMAPTRRPSSSSGVSPILERRASTSSRHSLRDYRDDKRRQVYGAQPAYPGGGWGEPENPIAGFLTTSQGMYHDHLREEGGIAFKSSPKQSRILGLDSPGIKPTSPPFTAEGKTQTNGSTKSGKSGLDRAPSESGNARKSIENGAVRRKSVENGAAKRKSVENLTGAKKAVIEAPATNGVVETSKPSGTELTRKASISGRPRSSQSTTSALRRSGSKTQFEAAAEKKKLDKGKGKEVVRIVEDVTPAVQEQPYAAAPSPQAVNADPVTPKSEKPTSDKLKGSPEHGFIFPFAQAVTVDKPVVLPSANLVYQTQNDENSPTAVEKTINEAYQLPRTEANGTAQRTASPTGPQNGPDVGLGIAPGDINRASSSAGGFVGGWKLDTMMGSPRRFSRDVVSSIGAPGGVSASSSTSSNRTVSSTGSGALLPPSLRAGLTRKYSYSTLEGMALVEGGRNGNEVTLTDTTNDQVTSSKQQHEYAPFRAVTVLPLPPNQSASLFPPGSEIVLQDGSLLPVPKPHDQSRPRSRAESPHWEPMVPVDRKKDKKKTKRRWFGSMRKDKDDGAKDTTAGLSNVSSKSSYSTGSSGSSSATGAVNHNGSGSDRSNADSATPPSSAASQSSANTVGKNGSSATVGPSYNGSASVSGSTTNGIADFAYTSQRLNAMAAAAHPSGPPHLQYQHPPPPPPPQPFTIVPTPIVIPPTPTQPQPQSPSEHRSQAQQSSSQNVPQPARGRARTRESGLRYEVRDSPSPTTSTSSTAVQPPASTAPSSSSSSSAPSTPRASSSRLSVSTLQQVHQQHRKTHSVSSTAGMTAEQTLSEKEKTKPLGKLFVVCCNCEYWHDLPSQMYYEMHERGCTVKCVYCLHAMGVKCCTGYSCAVYVLQKHHGRI